MFRWTGITPVYQADGQILEYDISVDAQNSNKESAFGTIKVKASELDLEAVNVISREKLIEMLSDRVDNK